MSLNLNPVNELSRVLDALADPSRLHIVHLIASAEDGELRCGSFDSVGVSKPTLSHHFTILREAGVIKTRVDGNVKFNSLCRESLNEKYPGLLDAVLKTFH